MIWGENLLRYHLLPKVKQGIDQSGTIEDLSSKDENELRADVSFSLSYLLFHGTIGSSSLALDICLFQCLIHTQAESKQVTLWSGKNGDDGTQAALSSSSTHHHFASLMEGPGANVEVIFLGTGSAMPSKYRNVSGIYVRLLKGE